MAIYGISDAINSIYGINNAINSIYGINNAINSIYGINNAICGIDNYIYGINSAINVIINAIFLMPLMLWSAIPYQLNNFLEGSEKEKYPYG
ncbi:hypothetical protein O181_129985 [Austropuccinia psidii MF-1]|uniref:Uncharacterized protein n=1 Tax=Austropuccinia psidii MF-1 TaxID=1389203 RepID=A0A9Q3QAI5_9BASI|nr:hypothetical protein [Austropuccinia psidii MF-1]